MKKNALCLMLALVMLMSLLAGCGSGNQQNNDNSTTPPAQTSEPAAPDNTEPAADPAADEVTLTFWTPTWRQAAEEVIIADFMEKYPNIKIETTYMSSDDIKANTKIAASSNTLPDMWYNWGGVLADFYAKNGLCLDLSDYAASHNWSDRFLGGALEQATYEGQLVGLPQNLIGIVMFYRADIFKQYNLTPPTTLEELEAVCDTLLANGITPMTTYGNALMRTHEALLEYYAGEEEHDKLLLMEADWSTSEAVSKSFAKLKEWIDKGYFPATVLTEDSNSAKMLMYSGSAAMTMENPGMSSEIYANEYNAEDYAWFAFPSGTGRISAYAKLCQFNANITDEKLEAAMLFWDYYYSAESIAAHDLIEQPTATIGVELPETYALADGMLEAISDNGSFAVMDLKMEPVIMSQYFTTCEAVVLGSTAPEAAGAEIQAAVDNFLANQ